jgi:hypothetical protein
MSAQQHFWDLFMAWGLGLGFVVIIVILAAAIGMMTSSTFQSEWKLRRAHKRQKQLMKMRAELSRRGTDPEYVKFLEKEAFKETR